MDKTSNLRTSPWALGDTDQHFSPFSDILWTKIEKMIARLIDNENNRQSGGSDLQLPGWMMVDGFKGTAIGLKAVWERDVGSISNTDQGNVR